LDVVKEKARVFLSRLLANPTLQGFNVLQKEDQIVQFLQLNLQQLYPTLSSASFFPGQSQRQIFIYLLNGLYEMTNETLFPRIEALVNTKIEYAFLANLRQQRVPIPKIKEGLYQFLTKLLAIPDARRSMTGCFAALEMNYPAKYLAEVARHKSYVHRELTMVQRLKMTMEEIGQMVNLSLILRPAIHMTHQGEQAAFNEHKAGLFSYAYVSNIKKTLLQTLNFLPPEIIESALNSSLSFLENSKIEATSRITSLLDSRCKGLKKGLSRVKGAETSDKSWFNVARRNFKFFGYDIKVLDELYRIASENGW
jgi:hypothetical protein